MNFSAIFRVTFGLFWLIFFSGKSNGLTLLNVYPDSPNIPANLLRFHFIFSEPVLSGQASSSIGLFDEAGKPLSEVLLETPTELWNPEKTILTIYLNPARIKRPLLAYQASGPHFDPTTKVMLRVSTGFLNQNGEAMQETFSKTYKVSEPARNQISPDRWKLNIPRAGTKERLTVNFFTEPDLYTLKNRLTVIQKNRRLRGASSFSMNGRVWAFQPEKVWGRVPYQLVVEKGAEDIAGNTLFHAFEWRNKNLTPLKSREDSFVNFFPQ